VHSDQNQTLWVKSKNAQWPFTKWKMNGGLNMSLNDGENWHKMKFPIVGQF